MKERKNDAGIKRRGEKGKEMSGGGIEHCISLVLDCFSLIALH